LASWNRTDAERMNAYLVEKTKDKPLDPAEFLRRVQEEYNHVYAYFEQNTENSQTSLADLLAEATKQVADNTTRLVASVQQLMTDVACAGQAAHQMLERHDTLTQLATTDSLTETRNREGFTSAARDIVAKAQRYGIGYAIAYLDMDRFKQMNDTPAICTATRRFSTRPGRCSKTSARATWSDAWAATSS
jgi:predicted signal transduction protein with EAL and GGDEF domain